MPLADVITETTLPRALFDAMIAARRLDADRNDFTEQSAVRDYARDTAGALAELAARALGAREREAGIAATVGAAAGIGALIAAQPALSEHGLTRIPSSQQKALAQDALDAIRTARRQRVPARIAPALRHVWRTERILQAATVSDARLAALTDLSDAGRKFGYIWRSALGRW